MINGGMINSLLNAVKGSFTGFTLIHFADVFFKKNLFRTKDKCIFNMNYKSIKSNDTGIQKSSICISDYFTEHI